MAASLAVPKVVMSGQQRVERMADTWAGQRAGPKVGSLVVYSAGNLVESLAVLRVALLAAWKAAWTAAQKAAKTVGTLVGRKVGWSAVQKVST